MSWLYMTGRRSVNPPAVIWLGILHDVGLNRRKARFTGREGPTMPKLRVHNFSISLDGYAAGPNQSREDPLGVGGARLHEWVFETEAGRRRQGMDGGAG